MTEAINNNPINKERFYALAQAFASLKNPYKRGDYKREFVNGVKLNPIERVYRFDLRVNRDIAIYNTVKEIGKKIYKTELTPEQILKVFTIFYIDKEGRRFDVGKTLYKHAGCSGRNNLLVIAIVDNIKKDVIKVITTEYTAWISYYV